VLHHADVGGGGEQDAHVDFGAGRGFQRVASASLGMKYGVTIRCARSPA